MRWLFRFHWLKDAAIKLLDQLQIHAFGADHEPFMIYRQALFNRFIFQISHSTAKCALHHQSVFSFGLPSSLSIAALTSFIVVALLNLQSLAEELGFRFAF